MFKNNQNLAENINLCFKHIQFKNQQNLEEI
jgi:hypothetical protein